MPVSGAFFVTFRGGGRAAFAFVMQLVRLAELNQLRLHPRATDHDRGGVAPHANLWRVDCLRLALGTLALTLLSELQTLGGRHFRQSPLNILASEQRDAPRPEPLLGDTDQLLECIIARVAE